MNTSPESSKKILGTKVSLHHSRLLISSGIPSFDYFLGGGLPLGCVFLIEEDVHGKYSDVMFKYFLSEGVVCNQTLFVASLDNDPKTLITEIPSPTNIEKDVNEKEQPTESNDMKIAWRYNNLKPGRSTLDSNVQFAHYFDISKPMDKDILNEASIHYWNADDKSKQDTEYSVFDCLHSDIEKMIAQNGFIMRDDKSNNTVLRIGIQSLGSPYWYTNKKNSKMNANDYKNLRKFLYLLRVTIRNSFAAVFVTIPTHLIEDSDTVSHLRYNVDRCIKLKAFAGTDMENNPALKDYHGFFHISNQFYVNLLAPPLPSTLDLAFKLRLKKFVIEKLHLPPGQQECSEYEQDDSSSSSCSSSATLNNFEF